MLKWFGKLSGGLKGRGGQEPPDPPEEVLSGKKRESLKHDLAKLGKAHADLPPRATRFVLTGQDEAVLLEIASRGDAGGAMALKCLARSYPDRVISDRTQFFSDFEGASPGLHLRLARLYEAASRRASPRRRLNWMPVPPWLRSTSEATPAHPMVYYGTAPVIVLPASLLEDMVAADGGPKDLLARVALLADPRDWDARHMSELVAGTSGFGAYLARHPVVVEEALSQKEAHRKVHALEVLARVKAPVPPFANILASLAVSSAKTVREAAGQILAGFTGARAALEVKAREGDPGERGEAASLLVRLAGDAARAFLEERLAAEGSPKVKRIVEELLHGPAAAAAVATEEGPPLSPRCLSSTLTRR